MIWCLKMSVFFFSKGWPRLGEFFKWLAEKMLAREAAKQAQLKYEEMRALTPEPSSAKRDELIEGLMAKGVPKAMIENATTHGFAEGGQWVRKQLEAMPDMALRHLAVTVRRLGCVVLLFLAVGCGNEERIVLSCTSKQGEILLSRSDVKEAEIFSNGVIYATVDGVVHTDRWVDPVNCNKKPVPK